MIPGSPLLIPTQASQNPNYQLSDVRGTGVLHLRLVPIISYFVFSISN